MARKDDVCYVIMPFAEPYSATYRDAIRPAVEWAAKTLGKPLRCLRGDEIPGPGSITREIVASIHAARVVIADLSDNNPNVFYELGIAHSVGNKTVMIARDVKNLPFDVHAYRVLHYAPSETGLVKLRDELVRAIISVCEGVQVATNPVHDFAPICHSQLIVSVYEVMDIERSAQAQVWLIVPCNDTDLKFFGDVIRDNLLRGVKYRYILPRNRRAVRGWHRLREFLRLDEKGAAAVEFRFVEEHLVESEVVIYDPYLAYEKTYLMSPIEEAVPFFYRVRGSKAETIKHRFEDLWEKGSVSEE
jgi:hypothetical protein